MAILEQPGPAQLQGQRGSCIPVTLGGVGQLKVELVPLAPCSRQRGRWEGAGQALHSKPFLQEQFPPGSGLCSHLAGIKSKFGQRHLPAEPHDLPVHQLHCKAQRGQRRGKNTKKSVRRAQLPPAPALLCSQHSQRGGKQDRPIRSPPTIST